jgi:hypothetical protein
MGKLGLKPKIPEGTVCNYEIKPENAVCLSGAGAAGILVWITGVASY